MASISEFADKLMDTIKEEYCYTVEKRAIGYMEPYVLMDTGELRQSASATTDLENGSVTITYNTPYAADAYNLPPFGFTPTTPGSNSEWNKFFEDSFDFQVLLRQLEQDVTSGLKKITG